jgi:hypothetical protein
VLGAGRQCHTPLLLHLLLMMMMLLQLREVQGVAAGGPAVGDERLAASAAGVLLAGVFCAAARQRLCAAGCLGCIAARLLL